MNRLRGYLGPWMSEKEEIQTNYQMFAKAFDNLSKEGKETRKVGIQKANHKQISISR